MGGNTGKVREFCQSGKVGTMIYNNVILVFWILFVRIESLLALGHRQTVEIIGYREFLPCPRLPGVIQGHCVTCVPQINGPEITSSNKGISESVLALGCEDIRLPGPKNPWLVWTEPSRWTGIFFVVVTSLFTPGSFVILHPGESSGIPCLARKSELITIFFYDS